MIRKTGVAAAALLLAAPAHADAVSDFYKDKTVTINWREILTNPEGGYSYVFDIDEETRKWRDQNQGRRRRERWEEKAEA